MEKAINNKNKSIALVSNNYWTLYKFRYDVIQMFLKKGYQVILIAGKDLYHQKFNDTQIKKIFLPIDERGLNPISEIKTLIKLYQYYKKIKPDLTIHFTIKPNIYGSMVCKFLNINSISFITGIGRIFLKNKSILKNIIIKLYRFALSNNKEVWFTNKMDRELFIKNKIIHKSFISKIVPGAGICFNNYKKSLRQDKEIKFLMISRVLKYKGVIEFLKVAETYKNNENIKFMLLGALNDDDPEGIDREFLNKYIQNGSMSYLDYQEDIMPLLGNASCLIHPSYREGMSTVLLEAASIKIPIITTSAPGCIDIIPDNSYGLLCKPKSVNSLRAAVDRFLELKDDDKDKMTNKTYNHVKKNFSRDVVLKKYEELDVYIN
ncbi:MAG: N,N'-diacetylbacillosaminyl-diphospho-undecaprenol alpha-1,3-N-acetylgalactosaminyltransferase [Gammaproteobacteria bacterium]|nr:MAG: N,N'-diacetylbacillosaminyl-diphospho-undecaprenol alpha-1,3-N-acetylgalactosaminyltransferase [Gammaproteobacteria bacterium]